MHLEGFEIDLTSGSPPSPPFTTFSINIKSPSISASERQPHAALQSLPGPCGKEEGGLPREPASF